MHARASQSLAVVLLIASWGARTVKSQNFDNGEERAREIYLQARTAIGGELALNALRTLSATGEIRAVLCDKTLPMEFRMDLILPDKFLKSFRTTSAGMPPRTYIESLNGDEVWTNLAGIQGLAPAGADLERIPIGGGREPGCETPGTPGSTSAGNATLGGSEIENRLRINLSSLMTAILLPDPTSLRLKCRPKIKQAMVTDVSEILEFSAPGGQLFDLYIDRITHRPAMISYKLPAYGATPGKSPDRSARLDRPKSVAELLANRVLLSDYRVVSDKSVGELWLPHRITWVVDGGTYEDIRVQIYTLNPSLNPKLFEVGGKFQGCDPEVTIHRHGWQIGKVASPNEVVCELQNYLNFGSQVLRQFCKRSPSLLPLRNCGLEADTISPHRGNAS